jgi:hypothetical protein
MISSATTVDWGKVIARATAVIALPEHRSKNTTCDTTTHAEQKAQRERERAAVRTALLNRFYLVRVLRKSVIYEGRLQTNVAKLERRDEGSS